MLLGERAFEATPGPMVAKPRGIRGAAWNARTEPARSLQIIAPEGFEFFFREVTELCSGPADPAAEQLQEMARRYESSFELDLVEELIQRHGLSAAPRYE